jgi:hypothetical protein
MNAVLQPLLSALTAIRYDARLLLSLPPATACTLLLCLSCGVARRS